MSVVKSVLRKIAVTKIINLWFIDTDIFSLNTLHFFRGKWRSTTLWGTPPIPISEKAINQTKLLNASKWLYFIGNQFWKWSWARIAGVFEKLVHFYFKIPHCAFNGRPESYRKCEWTQKHQKVFFVTIFLLWRDIACFYSCISPILRHNVEQIFRKLLTFG